MNNFNVKLHLFKIVFTSVFLTLVLLSEETINGGFTVPLLLLMSYSMRLWVSRLYSIVW
jgi:hypothetical protein